MKEVTAGRDYLGDLAPQFAALNDDILFGEVWSRTDALSAKNRSMITIAGLMGAGILDLSMKGHLETGKENGISLTEIVEIVTQLGFYLGWPKAWAVFALVGEVYQDELNAKKALKAEQEMNEAASLDADLNEAAAHALFGPGERLESDNFTGPVFVRELLGFEFPMIADEVVFAPGIRNNWHIHQKQQVLMVADGIGWIQEEGKPAVRLQKGDVYIIPAKTKHWHGAAADSWFSHLALEDWSGGAPEWLEPVTEEIFQQAGQD